jgi:TPR repeat protein
MKNEESIKVKNVSLVDQEESEALYELGMNYYNGNGVNKDYYKAAEWYRKASDQGYAKAQYNLAICYYNGFGVNKDINKTEELLKLAAEQGHAKAKTGIEILKK